MIFFVKTLSYIVEMHAMYVQNLHNYYISKKKYSI